MELNEKNALIVQLQSKLEQEEEKGDDGYDEYRVIPFDPNYKSGKVVLSNNNRMAECPNPGWQPWHVLCGGGAVSSGINVWRFNVEYLFLFVWKYHYLFRNLFIYLFQNQINRLKIHTNIPL